MNTLLEENLLKMGIIFFSILGIFVLLKLIIFIFFANKDFKLVETTTDEEEVLVNKNFTEIELNQNKLFLNSESNFLNNNLKKEKEFDSDNDEEYKKRELNET